MGKLIICSGKQARNPYHMKLTDTRIYSMEELCYYIYNHIDLITEELFQDSLVTWIREEALLAERADKLKELLNQKAGLKDVVVCILCSADYYSEAEIKDLLRTMDEILVLTPFERRKKKADNCLRYRQFTRAALEYGNIVEGKEAALLPDTEYGNLLHNLGIARLNAFGAGAAADCFKAAYEKNHNMESLAQYIYAVKLSRQEERLREDGGIYGLNTELLDRFFAEVDQAFEEAKASPGYQEILELDECRQTGKISRYYTLAEEIIGRWKQEFRNENA